MKQILLGALILTTLFSATSCVKVNFDESTVAPGPIDSTSNVISGTISSSRFYAKGKYILKGYVYVTEGATLTFEAGSVIQSDVQEKGALIIERGAKLIAAGTAQNPIVFTSGKVVLFYWEKRQLTARLTPLQRSKVVWDASMAALIRLMKAES
jgi:hypothetical protein